MRTAEAYAKINLGLIVGPARPDGKHEVVTVLQRIGLSDTIRVEVAPAEEGVVVEGYEDTLVRTALEAFGEVTRAERGWRVEIDKRIPVAAGLGGGSADAAVALRLANELGGNPLTHGRLHGIAAAVGADVPFFLRRGAQLATGDGTVLAPVSIPDDLPVVIVLPAGEGKKSTADVYAHFDNAAGPVGFEQRRDAMLSTVERVTNARDLSSLPGNDLASSALAGELESLGAFRAEVSGAGPAVYGLFESEEAASHAAQALRARGRTWLTQTVEGT